MAVADLRAVCLVRCTEDVDFWDDTSPAFGVVLRAPLLAEDVDGLGSIVLPFEQSLQESVSISIDNFEHFL